jgi:hypothetical protein
VLLSKSFFFSHLLIFLNKLIDFPLQYLLMREKIDLSWKLNLLVIVKLTMMKRYLLMGQTKRKVSIPLDDVLVVAIFYLFSMLLIGCCYRRIRSAGATEEMSLELNIFYV